MPIVSQNYENFDRTGCEGEAAGNPILPPIYHRDLRFIVWGILKAAITGNRLLLNQFKQQTASLDANVDLFCIP